MNITNYDKWKFRRCIETLDRYGCESEDIDFFENVVKCEKCSYNINIDMWIDLHNKVMSNNVSE